MKKYIILLLFFIAIRNINADILDRLSEITKEKRINFFLRGIFEFSLFMEENDLVVGIFTDRSWSASIMAYKIVDNTIKVIVQNRAWELVTPFYDYGRYSTTIDINHYYLVEMEEINGKLEYFCNRIDEINLNNFIINDAKVYSEIKAKLGPSLQWNDAIELKEGTPLKVVGVEKEGNEGYNTFDYWYKVIIQEKTYWVFGYYIKFMNRIKILELQKEIK
jgi:hypothetical protein